MINILFLKWYSYGGAKKLDVSQVTVDKKQTGNNSFHFS